MVKKAFIACGQSWNNRSGDSKDLFQFQTHRVLMGKKKKFRVEFRKNRAPRARKTDWTRQFDEHHFDEQSPEGEERISGRGEMARRRTVFGADAGTRPTGRGGDLRSPSRRGRSGLPPRSRAFRVRADKHRARRRRHNVPVRYKADSQNAKHRGTEPGRGRRPRAVSGGGRGRQRGHSIFAETKIGTVPAEGFIERVEPRHGTIARSVRGRRQVLVANVDQMLIVASVASRG